MSTRFFSSLLALTLALAAGCDGCGDEPPEPTATSARRAPSTPADVVTPTVEQLPLPQDYSEYAGKTVTQQTYRAELDRIAAELAEHSTPAE